MEKPPPKRHAKIYARPRLGVKLTPRLAASVAGLLASTGGTAWWLYRHFRPGR